MVEVKRATDKFSGSGHKALIGRLAASYHFFPLARGSRLSGAAVAGGASLERTNCMLAT
jgi:hypothetical protein